MTDDVSAESTPHQYLSMIERRLQALGLHTRWLDDDHLQVTNLADAEAGPSAATMHNTITCEPRTDAGGDLWFFGVHEVPIGPVERLPDRPAHQAQARSRTGRRGRHHPHQRVDV
ncbi:hypothetical protein ACFHW2_40150 [Actinomadura sp. LOL_016]